MIVFFVKYEAPCDIFIIDLNILYVTVKHEYESIMREKTITYSSRNKNKFISISILLTTIEKSAVKNTYLLA